MRKIKFVLDIGDLHEKIEEIIITDDDVTDDEIEEMLNDWILSQQKRVANKIKTSKINLKPYPF